MPDMNLQITPTVSAFVSTADGLFVRCQVQMLLSSDYLMPMYAAEAIEGHPFDGQRKVIVPNHRVSFSYAGPVPQMIGDQPHE